MMKRIAAALLGLGRIDRTEARMRDRHSGRLTYRDRLRLQHHENRASRHLYRAKHNGRHY